MKFLIPLTLAAALITSAHAAERWSKEKANDWYAKEPWPVGANFSPVSAINQLEMWQADTFDPAQIDKELGWAQGLGFNTVRVFLHNLLWEKDGKEFLARVETFLDLCEKHKIKPMIVLLDDVWNPEPKLGPQPTPRAGVHNSGWVQAPGKAILGDESRWDELKPYITGVISHFKNDKRILVWDLYNEPGNLNSSAYGKVELPNKEEASLGLLKKVVGWAREVNPSQPCTIGVWIGDWTDPKKLSPLNEYQIANSDVISFHQYEGLEKTKQVTEALQKYGRPVLCTEYMARPRGSTFEALLPWFKEQKVGAYNWGFVAGKTNTLHGWDTWQTPDAGEPKVWFHDILRADGTPYSEEEVTLIKSQTGAK